MFQTKVAVLKSTKITAKSLGKDWSQVFVQHPLAMITATTDQFDEVYCPGIEFVADAVVQTHLLSHLISVQEELPIGCKRHTRLGQALAAEFAKSSMSLRQFKLHCLDRGDLSPYEVKAALSINSVDRRLDLLEKLRVLEAEGIRANSFCSATAQIQRQPLQESDGVHYCLVAHTHRAMILGFVQVLLDSTGKRHALFLRGASGSGKSYFMKALSEFSLQ